MFFNMLLTKIGSLDTVPPSLRYLCAHEDKAQLIAHGLEKLGLKHTIFFIFETSWSDQMWLDSQEISVQTVCTKVAEAKKPASLP